jgi:hypothetical protein
MSRYLPSRTYLHAAIAAFGFSGVSAYVSTNSIAALVPAVLLLASSVALLFLFLRPAVEIHGSHLAVGDRRYSWNQIRVLDHSGWVAPLVVTVGLQDKSSFLLIFPGDLESATMLLRELRRHAENAMIDGVPHREYWRMEEAVQEDSGNRAAQLDADKPRYPLLSPGDEEEVERLYQRLKTVGHLDSRDDQ